MTELFFEIQREKLHIFMDAKETWTVEELKKAVEGITKIPLARQQLHKETESKEGREGRGWEKLVESATLAESGFTAANAKAQAPAPLCLVLQAEGGGWEAPTIAALSQPPPLPDVMRPNDNPNPDKPDPSLS